MTLRYRCRDNRTRIRRLTKLYNALKHVPEQAIDISTIVNGHVNWKTGKLTCGTTACIFGHFPIIFKQHYEFGQNSESIVVRRKNNDPYIDFVEECEEFLGLEEYEAKALCLPSCYCSTNHKKEALQKIKVLIEKYSRNYNPPRRGVDRVAVAGRMVKRATK